MSALHAEPAIEDCGDGVTLEPGPAYGWSTPPSKGKGVAISLTRQALRALGRIKMTTRAMNIAGGTDDP